MTPEQWQRVFALVRASQGCAEDERALFLAENCASDEERAAAQSLLLAQKEMGSFLEQPSPLGSANQSTEHISFEGSGDATAIAKALSSTAKVSQVLPRGAMLGRYVVLNLLGKGGMGVVYTAYDPELDRKVAIKLLPPEGSERMQGTDGKARLLREAKAMARLSHVNVITVHDVGTLRDEVFVAMEYVDGSTLKQWLDTKPRKWREVVDIFVQAGRGLSAAHSAGIVHRDFKPDNVLIGKDGRPRVLDFGLARGTVPAESAQTVEIIRDGVSATPISPAALTDGVTKTGAVIGTPAYMAPEQLAGRDVDARTDQFSFCVALYQALYGDLPFEGDTLRERLGAIQEGRLRSPRASSNVPRWLREVVTRGLSANPGARYPSMEELLHQLQRNPKQTWTRFAAAAAVALLVSGTAWTAYRTQYNKRLLCRGAEGKLSSVWGEPQKQAVSAAFLATGLPYAADAVRGVNRFLDDYGRRWVAMETEACEATRLRGNQSEELLDLRISCLAQRREELKALAGIFATADRTLVEKSVTAARGLSDIEGCADIEALKAPVRPPADMVVRTKVEEVRLNLARVKALNEAGRYAEALPVARQAVNDGESLKYRPLEAETLVFLGETLNNTGEYRQSEELTLQAALVAESARHDEIAARAWGELISISSIQAKHDAAELWAKLAFAKIERMGGNDRLLFIPLIGIGSAYSDRGKYNEALDYYHRALELSERLNRIPDIARVLNNIGVILMRQGKYDEALPQLERALALLEQLVGPMHPDLARPAHNIGTVLTHQQKYERALTYYQRSLEIKERTLGPDHPQLAPTFQAIGALFLSQKNYGEAMQYFQRALLLDEKTFGTDHPVIADNLTVMGQTYLGLGQPAKALPVLERALQIYQSKEVDAARIGSAQFNLARALVELKREPKRARTLAEQARAGFKKVGGARKGVKQVEEWLSKHFPQ